MSKRQTIVYLHGFNSSPSSEKAQITQQFVRNQKSDFNVMVPALPPEPSAAIALVRKLINELGDEFAGLIGSSLGGYYSLFFCAELSCRAVLINPAITPYRLLSDYIGINENMYTGERYEVKAEHMEELQSFDRVKMVDPRLVYLVTQTSDEVLDASEASRALLGAKVWAEGGGDHSFIDYHRVLPSMMQFFASE